MPRLSIPVRSCAAIASIPCSVVARACRSSFRSHEQTSTTNPNEFFARPLLEWAVHLYHLRPRVIRLDAAYWGLRLIAWIHATLGAVAVVPWNPKRQKTPSASDLDQRGIGQTQQHRAFFGLCFFFFPLQRPPLCGWSAMARQVALTYTSSIIVALAAQQAGRPDLIRSPKRVLAHTWRASLWVRKCSLIILYFQKKR